MDGVYPPVQDRDELDRTKIHEIAGLPEGYAGTYWALDVFRGALDNDPATVLRFGGSTWCYRVTFPPTSSGLSSFAGRARSVARLLHDVRLICAAGAANRHE